jgi:hypothetical protein
MPLRTRRQGLELVQQLAARYGPQIDSLLKQATSRSLTFSAENNTNGDLATGNADTGEIAFDKKFLRNASLADLRGALIHETTHAYGAAYGKGQRAETLADYARYKLNPTETAGWSPSAAVLRYDANHPNQGDNMAGPGSNRTGDGSNKNTVINDKSKAPKPGLNYTPYGQNATPSPADPSTYGGYAAQVMGLQQRLAAAMAAKRTSISGAQAQYMMAKQAAAQQQVAGVTAAESNALQRGILGSSADLGGRAAAVTDAATARQSAFVEKNLAVAQAQTGAVGAVGEFYSGLGQAQFDVANAQANIAAQRYQNDQFDVLNQNYAALQAQWQAFLTKRGRARDSVPPSPYATGNTPSELNSATGTYNPYRNNTPSETRRY